MKTTAFLTYQDIFDRAVAHLLGQKTAGLLPHGGGAYRSWQGGCPIGRLIARRNYVAAFEGIPVRYIGPTAPDAPWYMETGIKALRSALLKARVNVFDERTVSLLSALQNVHDAFGAWEWARRLRGIAREYGLDDAQLRTAA